MDSAARKGKPKDKVMISISTKAFNRSNGEEEVDFSTTPTEGLE